MKIEKVVDFRTFHNLNEAEGQAAIMGAADQIVNIFFTAYGALVTKIGGYGDAINDLIKVGESKAGEKGKAMLDAISKVASKVDPKFQDAASEMVLAGKKIQAAYDTLIGTEQGKAEINSINDIIYKKIIALQKSTAEASKEAKESKSEITESEAFEEGSVLNEKLFDKTFTEERNQLISDIAPVMAMTAELADNSPTEELKTKCKALTKELSGLQKSLSADNEKFWLEMKRGKRVDELKRIRDRFAEIPGEIQETQKQALLKLGIDKKIKSAIDLAEEQVTSAIVELNKGETEKVEVSAEKKTEAAKEGDNGKEEEKKEEKKEGVEKEEIVSGTVDVTNLKKAGKNREAIRGAQKKINMLLSDDSQIKDDGLYGKNTEEAIKNVSSQYSSIAPEIKGLDGKKMTPAFLKFLDNFEKNKEKIASLFK
jgi:hypothetical protein